MPTKTNKKSLIYYWKWWQQLTILNLALPIERKINVFLNFFNCFVYFIYFFFKIDLISVKHSVKFHSSFEFKNSLISFSIFVFLKKYYFKILFFRNKKKINKTNQILFSKYQLTTLNIFELEYNNSFLKIEKKWKKKELNLKILNF